MASPSPAAKSRGIYWEAFLPPARSVAAPAFALPTARLSKSRTRKAKPPRSLFTQPQPALASPPTRFPSRPPTVTTIATLARGGEGDKAQGTTRRWTISPALDGAKLSPAGAEPAPVGRRRDLRAGFRQGCLWQQDAGSLGGLVVCFSAAVLSTRLAG